MNIAPPPNCRSSGAPGTRCSIVEILARKDCGYPGMKAPECVKNGCCWDDSIKGAHFCFYPAGISV